MGMSVNKPRAGGRRHRPMGEINVTPFDDVMLVLLIVFMVTAPLLTVGVEVDLPKTKAGQINADAAPLVVSVKADGSLFLQEMGVEGEERTTAGARRPAPRAAAGRSTLVGPTTTATPGDVWWPPGAVMPKP